MGGGRADRGGAPGTEAAVAKGRQAFGCAVRWSPHPLTEQQRAAVIRSLFCCQATDRSESSADGQRAPDFPACALLLVAV